MILQVYSIFDTKVGTFSPPFFMSHDQMAFRACQEVANDPNTAIGRHPGDFNLMKLGIFDDSTGAFDLALPVNLTPMVAFVRSTQPGGLL